MVASFQIPQKIWIEMHDSEYDTPSSCDALVEFDDGSIFTAHFVTLAHLRRQMELSYAVTKEIEYTPAVRYATLDTPHILVEVIDRNTIEDTIDNLIAQDVFESLFTQVTEDTDTHNGNEPRTTNITGARATQEVAAVVLSDVLVVDCGD